MNSLIFAKRNILNFFRDKNSVFFSLLSALIIIGLYVLFLGDLMVQNMQAQFGEQTRFIMDSWIMAGVISVTSITITMGAYEAIITDKTNKILKDFYSAPIKRSDIVIGYIISSFLIGLIICFITLIFAEIYILAYGGHLLSFISYLKIIGIMLISVLSNCFFVFFFVSFFKSSSAFATGSTILGTLIGFITGVYLPIGQLPSAIQTLVKLFPVSHSAVLLRQVMMSDAVNAALGGAEQAIAVFNSELGVTFSWGGTVLTPLHSILYLIIAAIVFFVLSVIRVSKKKDF